MDIIYVITDTISGLKYLGSKKNWKGEGTYYGSPSCQKEHLKKFKLQQIWIENLKNNKDKFVFEVLESYDFIEHVDLLKIELEYQIKLDVVKSMEYINAGFARKGNNGNTYQYLTEEQKIERNKKVSEGLKKNMLKV